MLVSIDVMKEYLGLPPVGDPALDPVLERSALTAQMLVDAYLGVPTEADPDTPVVDTRHQLEGVRVVRLAKFPVYLLNSIKLDDVVLPADQYTLDKYLGTFQFVYQRHSVRKLEISYVPGWDYDSVPSDLLHAMTSIAINLYESGGKIEAASVATGALKSLTMFDAMSMSFETGTGASSAATQASGPELLVSQWGFVLNKYKVIGFTMG